MKISEITHYLESIAPLSYQEDYDNSGFIVGNAEAEARGVLVCLDCVEEVVQEAIEANINLIVAHHPIVFRGIKQLTGKNYIERTLLKAIKNDIAIYAIHTNLDNVLEGVNGQIAHKLGLKDCRILNPKQGLLHKLVTYCPESHAETLRKALFEAGAGHIGNYSECSFNTSGLGTFRANAEAEPFVGEINRQHHEVEQRIEVLIQSYQQKNIIATLLQNHPYEEVAYDIIPLGNPHQQVGSGLIGILEQEMEAKECLQMIKENMQVSVIKHTQLLPKKIKTIALCGGAGSFLLSSAIAQKADLYLSADFKYHEYFDADKKIIIADIGHYESEQFTQQYLFETITKKFAKFAVRLTEFNTNPVKYLI